MFVASEMTALPEYFQASAAVHPQKAAVNAGALKDLFHLESTLPQDEEWVAGMNRVLTEYNKRDFINTVLVPVILDFEKETPLSKALLSFSKNELQERVDNQPQPPANWTRPVPEDRRNARIWQMLAPFLQSPTEQVFDFRRNQQERNELEAAIQQAKIDLYTETIKKGSPYTLRITKNQAAYEKQRKEWREDVALLEKVGKKQEGYS
jgi:hypothetical protein